MKPLITILLSLSALIGAHAETKTWRVGHTHGDFVGTTEEPILKAILAANENGGGTVLIQGGVYQLRKGFFLESVKGVTIRGEGKVTLQLRPAIITELKTALQTGDRTLSLKTETALPIGLRLRVMAPEETNSFTGKPTPHFTVTVASVKGDTVMLKEPAKFPAPAHTRAWDEDDPNLFEIRGDSERIIIENLELEGSLKDGDIQQATHNTRCGVFIQGRYDYAKGPLGPKPKEIMVRNCRIQNFHGRGVAIYSSERCVVENCQISNTLDEGVDLDHFANGCTVRSNVIRRASVGIEMNDANDSQVEKNRIEDSSVGIRMWRWCQHEELNVRNEVRNNQLKGIRRQAIDFQEGTANNVVQGNRLELKAGDDTKKEKWFRDAGKSNRWVENEIATGGEIKK
ncbi:MAG: Pectate lyase superfamily protein [Verrucomicrobia bacterium]|nr:Pectate lyase superfamily protein [Verrucomicrobiota bacterium]